MVVFTVHTKCLKDRYLTTLCSTTTLFVVVISLICIIFPFIVAYRSRGFWIKHDTFFEQPDVKYRNEFLFIASTNNNPLICNNLIRNNQLKLIDSCSLIKVKEVDSNNDGKLDEIDFTLTINLPQTPLDIKLVTLILTFNYHLTETCPLTMQTAAILQITNILTNAVSLYGELKTHQSFSLPCFGRSRDLSHNYSIASIYDKNPASGLRDIIENYNNRNISTHMNNIYMVSLPDNEYEFTINAHLKINQQIIYYSPSFWQIIKWAWIQYFSIFVVFFVVFRYVKNYVFTHHLVLFYKLSVLKQKVK